MTIYSTWITRGARAGMLVALTGLLAAEAALARPEPNRPRTRRGFNLFASAELPMNVNRVFCGINNLGEVCVALAGSPVAGGGVWPRGTPDQYIFNSGLQLAGIIPATAGFAWAGDTVGAYFMDPRGTQAQGDGVTNVYSSLDPTDVADWPNGAVVRDTTIYSSVLIGRNVISQQDIWVRSWDGNPSLLSGRTHPMGVLVEIRGLGWNFPSGNEDILYFIYTFYNVTASDAASYASLDPAIRSEIAAVGQQFQDGVKARLGVTIPSGGYRFDELYAAFFMDPDVGDANANYSTGILPFNLGIAYKSDFREVDWQFPADIFGAPFAPAPGFVGVKYLRSPVDPATNQQIGISLFSNTLNAVTGFPDPVGVVQLWRYLSGNASPSKGDNPCTFPNPKQRKLCFLFQQPIDTRFYQSSGPFSLDPGKSATIVVAYVHGAPVAARLAGKIGGDVKPGIPPTGAELAADATLVRPIDSITGWVSQTDANANGVIEQTEVQTVPRSLLDKALVAQAVFDTKFLLPFAPEPPTFHLVPGNNQVSIVWTKSTTETAGDPYFAVASNPANPALYDRNFQKIDVEGYRIYRGRTTAQLELIAQFDYDGTTFTDRTGNVVSSAGVDYGNRCAPELGIQTSCPVNFNAGQSVVHDIQSPFIQVKRGDRAQLGDGTVFIIKADTALTGAGFPALENTGVPFAFIDRGVRNSFTYHYAVTSFDVNSTRSGPSSLESARITKSVTPRAPSPNQVDAVLVSGLFGDDNVQLDPRAPWSIDPNTGRFSGTPPATDALTGVFAPLVPALLPALNLTAKVDSLVPHSGAEFACGANENALGSCYEVFITFNKDGQVTPFRQVVNWPVWSAFGEATETELALGSFDIAADAAAAQRFGIPANFSKFQAKVGATLYQYIGFSTFEGQASRRSGSVGIPNMGGGAGVSPGGSRWFDGANETVDHPTYGIRVGRLAGTDTVWAAIHHTDTDPVTPGNQTYAQSGAMQCLGYIVGGLGREADVQFTWGAGGTISAVRDLTHHVNVPFKPDPQASYGFVDDFNGNGRIDWRDFHYLTTVSPSADDGFLGFCGHTDPGPGARGQLLQQPKILPVTTRSNIAAEAGSNGFGLYVNGERYIFRLTGGNAPASGTKWTLRTYAGFVRAGSGAATLAPSSYTYLARPRPPIIPNLQVVFKVDKATQLAEETDSTLMKVHTVPDPYYVTTALESTTNTKLLKFVNLPPKAIIRIYSVSGILVQVLEHNDAAYGGEETWNLRSRTNQFVASGVYFYHVESPSGKSKIGRFTVVNFAQ